MCLAGEEQAGGSTGAGGSVGGSIPDIVVTAPRLGLNVDVYHQIDWAEVAKLTGIGAAAGAYSGGYAGAAVGAAAAAATAIESQPGIDLENLFQVKYDLPRIPGLTYVSMH